MTARECKDFQVFSFHNCNSAREQNDESGQSSPAVPTPRKDTPASGQGKKDSEGAEARWVRAELRLFMCFAARQFIQQRLRATGSEIPSVRAEFGRQKLGVQTIDDLFELQNRQREKTTCWYWRRGNARIRAEPAGGSHLSGGFYSRCIHRDSESSRRSPRNELQEQSMVGKWR